MGKGLAARLLAQAANCEGGPPAAREGRRGYRDDPCGACRPCLKIAHGTHPDVFVLAEERVMVRPAAGSRRAGRTPSKEIVVDQVRDLIDHRLAMRRFEGRRRVVIVDPADAMNAQAQNALLKTLEEPPDDTTLVLVSASPDALLPTVRARCLRVGLRAAAGRPSRRRWRPGAARPSRPGWPPRSRRLAVAGPALDAERWRSARVAEGRRAEPTTPARVAAREHGDDREVAAELGEAAAAPGGATCWRSRRAGRRLALAELAPLTAPDRRRPDAGRGAAPPGGWWSGCSARSARTPPAPLAVERMLIGWFHGL